MRLVVQTSGRVNYQNIRTPSLRRRQSVKQHRRRISSLFLLDQLNARTRRPDLKLVVRGGSKSIGGTDQHVVAFVLDTLGELADGGCFADAVYADDHQDIRLDRFVDGAFVGHAAFRRMMENVEQFPLHRVFERGKIADLGPRNAPPHAVEYLHRGRHADVGRDEHFLKLVQERFVDLFAALEDRIEPIIDRMPRFLDGLRKAHADLAFDGLFLCLQLLDRLVQPQHRTRKRIFLLPTPKKCHTCS